MNFELYHDSGDITDPDDIGCPTCNTVMSNEIFEAIDEILRVVPGAKFIDGDDGEAASWLTADENGNPSRRYLLTGSVRRRIARRRPEGQEGMVTPMVHLYDPSTNQYEELIISYTIGGTQDVETWEANSQYDADGIDNDLLHKRIHNKPWFCTRLLMRPTLRFYVKTRTRVDPDQVMSNLVPDIEHGTFQKGGWIDAFKAATQFR